MTEDGDEILKDGEALAALSRYSYETAGAVLQEYMDSAQGWFDRYPKTEQDVGAKVYVYLDCAEYTGDRELPFAAFLERLNTAAAPAPPGSELVIKFSGNGAYDDDESAGWEVGFYRDPTPEERAEREAKNAEVRAHNARLAEREAEEERAEFERLKAKFDPPA